MSGVFKDDLSYQFTKGVGLDSRWIDTDTGASREREGGGSKVTLFNTNLPDLCESP